MKHLIGYLSQSEIDIAFTLLDSFTTRDRIALRLFGEGTAQVEMPVRFPDKPEEDPISEDTARPGRRRSLASVVAAGRQSGQILGSTIHMEYQCTSIFHCQDDRLTDRWGIVHIR
jgi:hypothetical protein